MMISLLICFLSLITVDTFIYNQKVLKKSYFILNMNSNILLDNEKLPQYSKFKTSQVEPAINLILENLEKDFCEL